MPFIRYDQGDLGTMAPEGVCPCGRHSRAFASILGRRNANFVNQHNKKIPSASLLRLVDELLIARDILITSYRLHQISPDVLCLHFAGATDSSAREAVFTKLQVGLQQLFGHDVSLNYERYDEMPHAGSYKRQLLVKEDWS